MGAMTSSPRPAAAARTAGDAAQPAAGLTRAGLAVLITAVFLPQVDFFIVNVALPTIQSSLGASAGALELVVAGYGTAYAATLVLGGRLGDMIGRRRMLLIGMSGFVLTSLVCGTAPGIGVLLAARILQGAAAGLVVPQVIATLHATLSGERRHRALGLYSSAAGAAIVVGQLVGGLLVTADVAGTGWRPIFLVNVPIGAVALIAAGRFVPASRSPHPFGLDLVGTLLFAGTLVALLVPLAEGPTIGWPPWSWGALALVPVLAAATVVIERRAEAAGRVPLLPPSLLRLRSMRRGFAMHLPFMLTYGAFMFVFALTVQTGLHSGVLGGGLAVLPLAVAYFAGSLAAPRAIARFDTRRVVAVAAVAVALGLLALVLVTVTTWPHTDYWAFAPGLVLAGAGQALVFACLFRLILLDVPEHLVGVGGGVVTTVQQSGLALGVATLGTLFVGLEKTGVGTAFVVSLAVQAAIMLAIAAGSLTLPHLQARPGQTGVAVDV